MIEVSNTQVQIVQPGQAIVFDQVITKTNCCCFRKNAPRVKLNRKGLHKITANGNIGTVTGTGQVEIAIQLSGMTLPETISRTTSVVEGFTNNVTAITTVDICCGNYDTVTVVNTSDVPITVDTGFVLIAERLCM